jgi:hypothetical protein
MTFQIIQNDVKTPQEALDAIELLKEYGYDIPKRSTGKVITELHDIDKELLSFFRRFIVRGWPEWETGIKVSYQDLELLDFVGKQIADARGDENRDLRHAIVKKYFDSATSSQLYRNIAGFRKAFAQMDYRATFTVRTV